MKYPEMELIDGYKQLYQSFFLTGHLMTDKTFDYLLIELNDCINHHLREEKKTLYEYISSNVVRVNIYPYAQNFDIADLFIKFKWSSNNIASNKSDFTSFLEAIIKDQYFLANCNGLNLDGLVDLHQELGGMIPSHSLKYKKTYFPSYRIITTEFLDLDMRIRKIEDFIANIRSNEIKIISLEGRCCSGKSSITKALKNVTVIKCDDHYGIESPIDYLGLSDLLSNLKIGDTLKERCYDCSTQSYYYQEKIIHAVVIVEGVFSYSKPLRHHYDYLGYAVVTKDQQMKRLKIRESEEMLQQFMKKWIPREEQYYQDNDYIIEADILI